MNAVRGRFRRFAGERVASVGIGPPGGLPGIVVEMPADPAAYAAQLYAVLHDLDGRGLSRVLVEVPPDADEWLAVRDRLARAASP